MRENRTYGLTRGLQSRMICSVLYSTMIHLKIIYFNHMKILITGSYGQLGSEIKDLSVKYPQWQFLFTDADTFDITDEKTKNREINAVIGCAQEFNLTQAIIITQSVHTSIVVKDISLQFVPLIQWLQSP